MTSLVAPSSPVELAAAYGMPPPRYATPRNPGRRTMGPAVGRIARALRKTNMPWQQYVADVGGEVDDAGLFVYPVVIVSVPRQAGKTTLDLAQSVQRCLQGPNRFVWHTAQTGQDARDKWRELVDDVMASPLRELVEGGRFRKTNGSEALRFVNGSVLRPHPPTRDSLHGKQSDTNNVDEAWSFDEAAGADLLQAITPTQLTRPGAQTWIWSTRGDAHSTWFHGMIARALAGEPGVALFDWGIGPDVDPMDLAAVAAAHPAVGHTVTEDSLRRALATMSGRPGEFARAYGNRETGAGERVLPADPWNAAGYDPDVDVDAAGLPVETPAGKPAFGIAVAADGSAGALVAAVLDRNGVPWVEVIEHHPGRSWLVERVKRLQTAGYGIAGDRRGPAAPVLDQLELAGVELLNCGGTDYAAGCQDLFDRVVDPTGARIRHRRHAGLDDAADVAGRRTYSDGSWVWSRTKSGGDISPLEAATWAAWAVLRNKVERKPTFRFAA